MPARGWDSHGLADEWVLSAPSLVLDRLCLELSCLRGVLSWLACVLGGSVLDGPCRVWGVTPPVSWRFASRPQGLTLCRLQIVVTICGHYI